MENVIDQLVTVSGKIRNQTLFQRDGMRVAVVAIAAGDRLAAHSSPVDVLIIGLQGDAEVMIADQLHHFSPHMHLKFPANVIHSVAALSDFKMLLIK